MGYCFNKGTRKGLSPHGYITTRPLTSERVLNHLLSIAQVTSQKFLGENEDLYSKCMRIPSKYRIWDSLPYTSVFINFAKKGDFCVPHLDREDIFCTIYTIGDFEGGELANLNERILFTMKNNTYVNLLSSKITHASFPIKFGQRIAFILVAKDFKTDLGPVVTTMKARNEKNEYLFF